MRLIYAKSQIWTGVLVENSEVQGACDKLFGRPDQLVAWKGGGWYWRGSGQQVLASMAFLLALSGVLGQLDFLILDEPTTHLDENRRRELVTVFENLRRVPQLIIVDHHPELLEAAEEM